MTGGAQEAGPGGVEGGVLVVNAGSSSLRLAVFDRAGEERLSAAAGEIGGGASTLAIGRAEPRHLPLADHAAALAAMLDGLAANGVGLDALAVAGHRVVHGGPRLVESARITPAIRAEIEAAARLAPLHNPPALAAIDALAALAPDLPQVACFDTAFHAKAPMVARRYALPATAETAGIQRYGFHGISYQGLLRALPGLNGGFLPRRLLACHLGNGASLCAIDHSRSVATTMGYSPLSGLTMGTRAGDVDGNAVLDLAERVGIARAREILNRESGLRALGGASDMRALRRAAEEGDPHAAFALEHFAYWVVRQAGSMIAAMGGVSAIAFTGGIGEHDRETRAAIMDGLAFTGLIRDPAARGPRLSAAGSPVSAWVVPAAEEATIARTALTLMEVA